MCLIFGDEEIENVSGTRIYARSTADNQQILVYSMSLAARGKTAMVLPIPVPPNGPDDALQFIDLSDFPGFFEDINALFSVVAADGFLGNFDGGGDEPLPLKVHTVGDFIASYVPTFADFDRLDRCFRGSPEAWAAMPQYRDYGFAVFQLEATVLDDGMLKMDQIHPMAFQFPKRNHEVLFFPTIHVHDGKYHDMADFDHSLYFQCSDAERARMIVANELDLERYLEMQREDNLRKGKNWNSKIESWYRRDFHGPTWDLTCVELDESINIERSKGILTKNLPMYQRTIHGSHANQDILL